MLSVRGAVKFCAPRAGIETESRKEVIRWILD